MERNMCKYIGRTRYFEFVENSNVREQNFLAMIRQNKEKAMTNRKKKTRIGKAIKSF